MVNTHIVQVGGPNGSLAFYPSNIKAQPGDLVQFQFHPKNHSVAQSTFDQPCVPIQNIQANKTDAFYSGFMPTNASLGATANVLTYTIRVKDEKPVWFYCTQGRHCQAGMVGAINAPASGNRTMQAFVALAAQAPENLSPGQAAGSGTQNTPNSPSGPAGGNSPSGTNGGNTPPSPAGSGPAQQSANVAPGFSSQSFFGLGAAAIAAFAML
jgi:plastocyanin